MLAIVLALRSFRPVAKGAGWLFALGFMVAAQAAEAPRYPKVRPVRSAPVPELTRVVVEPTHPKQTILGLGFEIQSDSIASGNMGLPLHTSSVPHDLVPEERARLCATMLEGFRYCRLAGGLYWRGLTPDQKYLQPRWPEQLEELREMIQAAHLEGVSLEYWSPAPFWKANRKYTGRDGTENVLRCFGANFATDADYHGDTRAFLKDFAGACVRDLRTLKESGIPVKIWGMQNEPWSDTPYSSCKYEPTGYAAAFRVVAPAVRAFDPGITIIADTSNTWDFAYIRPVLDDPATASLVDALVIHHVGSDANIVRPPPEPSGKPRFQNEYEYQPFQGPASPDKCLNTVLHIMNWFQLGEAPAWFWIHALKPYKNMEASGYALGFWRPFDDLDDSAYPASLRPGHWIFNPYNWNAVGSFVKRLPWDSRCLAIRETPFDDDLRVFAFLRPNGKITVVLANRSSVPHRFEVEAAGSGRVFRGYRYTPEQAGDALAGIPLGARDGPVIVAELPDLAWEFWEEE